MMTFQRRTCSLTPRTHHLLDVFHLTSYRSPQEISQQHAAHIAYIYTGRRQNEISALLIIVYYYWF